MSAENFSAGCGDDRQDGCSLPYCRKTGTGRDGTGLSRAAHVDRTSASRRPLPTSLKPANVSPTPLFLTKRLVSTSGDGVNPSPSGEATSAIWVAPATMSQFVWAERSFSRLQVGSHVRPEKEDPEGQCATELGRNLPAYSRERIQSGIEELVRLRLWKASGSVLGVDLWVTWFVTRVGVS